MEDADVSLQLIDQLNSYWVVFGDLYSILGLMKLDVVLSLLKCGFELGTDLPLGVVFPTCGH